MDLEISMVLQALVKLWKQLPELFGEDWPEVEYQLRKFILELQKVSEEEEHLPIIMEIISLFSEYEEARVALLNELSLVEEYDKLRGKEVEEANHQISYTVKKEEMNSIDTKIAKNYLSHISRIAPEERYVEVKTPKKTALGKEFSLTVRLTQKQKKKNCSSTKLGVFPEKGIPLTVTLHFNPEDFTLQGNATQYIHVLSDQDSFPVLFSLTPKQQGAKKIWLKYLQMNYFLEEDEFEIEIVPSPPQQEEMFQSGASFVVEEKWIRPPDLNIMVRTERRGREFWLHYSLDSHILGYYNECLPPLCLENVQNLEEYHKAFLLKIQRIQKEKNSSRLKGLGQKLFQELFPKEFAKEYLKFREKVRSIQFVCSDVRIPWEMVYFYDSSQEKVIDDGFWGIHFQVARLFSGQNGELQHLQVKKMVHADNKTPIVSPLEKEAACPKKKATLSEESSLSEEESSLSEEESSFSAEQQILKEFGKKKNVKDASPIPLNPQTLLETLEQKEIGLWHFAVEITPDPFEPEKGIIQFEEEQNLIPDDLHSSRKDQLSKQKPFIFLNCRSPHEAKNWLSLQEWFTLFAKDSRCGAFVAPLWPIEEEFAQEFVNHFYEQISQRRSITEAIQETRKILREKSPENPNYLAYQIYSRSNVEILWGEEPVYPTRKEVELEKKKKQVLFHSGKRLKLLREISGVTQQEMLDTQGFPHIEMRTYQLWEKKGIPSKSIEMVVQCFDLEKWHLIDERVTEGDFKNMILHPETREKIHKDILDL